LIREAEGDILLRQADAIAHGIAPFDQFSTDWRSHYGSVSRRWSRTSTITASKAIQSPARRGFEVERTRTAASARIISLLTQDPSEGAGAMPGKASLHKVNHALKALARLIAEEKLTSLALPRLATGVGGLDRANVRPLIEKHLERLDIPVIIYTAYRNGLRADEKLAHCA